MRLSRITRGVFRPRPMDLYYDKSTIYAPATPPGKSALQIIRVCGPESRRVYERMIGPAQEISPRKALLRTIRDARSGAALDEGLVLFFPRQSSATAEDTLEMHLHGSPAVMKAVMASLDALGPDIRLAERGEFTRRAYAHGKLDLTQVEGIQMLLDSETEYERRQAMGQVSGRTSAAVREMQDGLVEAMALIEAIIDFGEDENIDEAHFEQAKMIVRQVSDEIRRHVAHASRTHPLAGGLRLALLGPPNAGKSSFVNWLSQTQTSIVTSVPGTTRDVVSVAVDFEGYPLVASDTAGVREGGDLDAVEAIGIERAKERVRESHLSLCLLSYDDVFPSASPHPVRLDPIVVELLSASSTIAVNKLDDIHGGFDGTEREYSGERRPRPWTPEHAAALQAAIDNATGLHLEIYAISLKTGLGLSNLKESLKKRIVALAETEPGSDATLVNARQALHLRECLSQLDSFDSYSGSDIVFAAEDLRMAISELGKIVGTVDVEDVLGQIFSRFCVGK